MNTTDNETKDSTTAPGTDPQAGDAADRQGGGGPTASRGFGRGLGGKRSLAVALGAVAIVGLSLSFARAQGFGGPGRFMKERLEHMLSAAGATDGQRAQIHAIWQGLRPQMRPLRHQAADLRHQIGEAIAAPTIDKARVETLRKQSVETMDRLSALFTQGMLASAQVLTPEQRRAVLEQVREHRRHDAGEEGDE